jgi:hypothetical protein
MSRLNDAGMHRPDRNLVQPLSFGRKKFIWRPLTRAGLSAQGVMNIPEAEIEPRPRVGRIHRFQSE